MRRFVTTAGIMAPLALFAALPLTSHGESLTHVQAKIDLTQRKIGEHQRREEVLTTTISRYSARVEHLQQAISALLRRQTAAQRDVDAAQAALEGIREPLRRERARAVVMHARLHLSREVLARRLVELYEAERPDLLTVVLNARGFADLIERAEFVKRISAQDQQIIAGVRQARSAAEAQAARLTRLETRQASIAARVARQRNDIRNARQQLVDRRTGLRRARAAKYTLLNRTRDAREALEKSARHLRGDEARIEAALHPGANGDLPTSLHSHGSGMFIWPVNGPVTSPYGPRILNGVAGFHPGIDIGAAQGTPIHAAASGRVAVVQSVAASGGFGNFTCVQHTQSIATCYAHQSRIATRLGARVSQGQLIGYVGNTGFSFGAHLDLEVRINGKPVNPLNYL